MADAPQPMDLKAETLEAFQAYIREAESGMQQTLCAGPFLWSDADAARAQKVRKGHILAAPFPPKTPAQVPDGLVHDWVGAAFLPGTTLADTLARIQDYDNHKNIYKPQVIDSKLLSRDGDDFKIFLRVLKKKIITVVLDTCHDVHYCTLNGARCTCRSYTTSVSEVDNAGKANETVQPPDTGYGFLWRLYSYWRFEERDGGLYAECRAISLTRDVPHIFRLIIAPMVRSLPKETLIHTLEATRKALVK
jgi:hypothetical protein